VLVLHGQIRKVELEGVALVFFGDDFELDLMRICRGAQRDANGNLGAEDKNRAQAARPLGIGAARKTGADRLLGRAVDAESGENSAIGFGRGLMRASENIPELLLYPEAFGGFPYGVFEGHFLEFSLRDAGKSCKRAKLEWPMAHRPKRSVFRRDFSEIEPALSEIA
jgi:hypothetical protein